MDKIDKYLTEKHDPELKFVEELQEYLKEKGLHIYHEVNNGDMYFSQVAKEIDNIKKDLDKFKRKMRKVPSGWAD